MLDLKLVRDDPEGVKAALADLYELQARLPNLPDPATPPGGEEASVELRRVGTPREFDFGVRDHLELGELLGAIDTVRAAKVSGARFGYLTGPGALLEFALVRFVMDRLTAAGFVPMIPPVLVRREAMFGTGFLPTDEQQIFRTADDDLYLAGTSEVPLVSYHSDELLDPVPPRGRLLRQGHPWHLPGPPVRQGRDGVLRAPRGLGGRAPAAAGPRGGDPPGPRAPIPGGRHRRRRPRRLGRPQVRLRGLDPLPGGLPGADLDLELHRLPGPPDRLPDQDRGGQPPPPHPQRH